MLANNAPAAMTDRIRLPWLIVFSLDRNYFCSGFLFGRSVSSDFQPPRVYTHLRLFESGKALFLQDAGLANSVRCLAQLLARPASRVARTRRKPLVRS